MTFRFRIPTQPPSVNHTYKIVRQYGKGGRPYMTLAKEPEVEQYQMVASQIAKMARPEGWEPDGFVRLKYWWVLDRDIDCDNMKKAINDALARAWKVNDKMFLSCDISKIVGNPEPYVEIEVDG